VSGLALRLWHGELGLSRTFWEYAILYGTLANLATTAASFAVLAGGISGWAALIVFMLPVPYNIFIVVAVWRSADRYPGNVAWANAARIVVVAWALVVSLV
jgi:hypothetical protein